MATPVLPTYCIHYYAPFLVTIRLQRQYSAHLLAIYFFLSVSLVSCTWIRDATLYPLDSLQLPILYIWINICLVYMNWRCGPLAPWFVTTSYLVYMDWRCGLLPSWLFTKACLLHFVLPHSCFSFRHCYLSHVHRLKLQPLPPWLFTGMRCPWSSRLLAKEDLAPYPWKHTDVQTFARACGGVEGYISISISLPFLISLVHIAWINVFISAFFTERPS